MDGVLGWDDRLRCWRPVRLLWSKRNSLETQKPQSLAALEPKA